LKKLFLSFQHNAAIVQMNTLGKFTLFNVCIYYVLIIPFC